MLKRLSEAAAEVTAKKPALEVKRVRSELAAKGYDSHRIALLLPQLGAGSQIDRIIQSIAGLLARKVKFAESQKQVAHKAAAALGSKIAAVDKGINAHLSTWRGLVPLAPAPYKLMKIPTSAKEIKKLGDLRELVAVEGAPAASVHAATLSVRHDVVYRYCELVAAHTEIRLVLQQLYYFTTYYGNDRIKAVTNGFASLKGAAAAGQSEWWRVVVRVA